MEIAEADSAALDGGDSFSELSSASCATTSPVRAAPSTPCEGGAEAFETGTAGCVPERVSFTCVAAPSAPLGGLVARAAAPSRTVLAIALATPLLESCELPSAPRGGVEAAPEIGSAACGATGRLVPGQVPELRTSPEPSTGLGAECAGADGTGGCGGITGGAGAIALEAGAVDLDTASAISATGSGCVCDKPASEAGSATDGGGGVNGAGRMLGGFISGAAGGMDGRRVGGGSFGALITSPLLDSPGSEAAARSDASRPGSARRSLVSSSSRSSASSGSSVSSSSISCRRPSAASGLGFGCETLAGGGGGGGPTYDPDCDMTIAGVDACTDDAGGKG